MDLKIHLFLYIYLYIYTRKANSRADDAETHGESTIEEPIFVQCGRFSKYGNGLTFRVVVMIDM